MRFKSKSSAGRRVSQSWRTASRPYFSRTRNLQGPWPQISEISSKWIMSPRAAESKTCNFSSTQAPRLKWPSQRYTGWSPPCRQLKNETWWFRGRNLSNFPSSSKQPQSEAFTPLSPWTWKYVAAQPPKEVSSSTSHRLGRAISPSSYWRRTASSNHSFSHRTKTVRSQKFSYRLRADREYWIIHMRASWIWIRW